MERASMSPGTSSATCMPSLQSRQSGCEILVGDFLLFIDSLPNEIAFVQMPSVQPTAVADSDPRQA
jgi:hypothetical protein